MRSLATLLLRLTVGGLLAGHGAQKLFGSFEGPGPDQFGASLDKIGLRPGRSWATVAGISEFGGGILTALGALNPLGPVMAMGSMLMAAFTVHEGKPVWAQQGGAELPLTDMAVHGSLILAGPGALSIDALLGLHLPRWFAISSILAMLGVVVFGLRSKERQEAARPASTQPAKAAAGQQGPRHPRDWPSRSAPKPPPEPRTGSTRATEPGDAGRPLRSPPASRGPAAGRTS